MTCSSQKIYGKNSESQIKIAMKNFKNPSFCVETTCHRCPEHIIPNIGDFYWHTRTLCWGTKNIFLYLLCLKKASSIYLGTWFTNIYAMLLQGFHEPCNKSVYILKMFCKALIRTFIQGLVIAYDSNGSPQFICFLSCLY